jgi:acetolactate synthase-1/2/3 large subunit
MSDAHLAAADLVVAIGSTLTRSHYTSHVPAGPRIIQIVRDPSYLSQSYPVEHLVCGDLDVVLGQLAAAAETEGRSGPVEASPAAKLVAQQKSEFMANGAPARKRRRADQPVRVIAGLMRSATLRMVVPHDSGKPRDQVVPFFEALTPLGTSAGASHTPLGSGHRASQWGKLASPDWLAVNFMGDTSFGMVGMEWKPASMRNPRADHCL